MARAIILGATGKVGQSLARVWPQTAQNSVWQHRPGVRPAVLNKFNGQTLCWDILKGPTPILPEGIESMIVLAGIMGQDEGVLVQNTDLALAAVDLARRTGIARILVASTQAVYGTHSVCANEATLCQPVGAYGVAKLKMEQALADFPEVTCLRLGNVAGTDSLFRAAARESITLDQFEDGTSPQRSYIGPVDLASVLLRLLDPAQSLPAVLNVANPGMHAMDQLLRAAGVDFKFRQAPENALDKLEIDVSQLKRLTGIKPVSAQKLVDQARLGGWLGPKDHPEAF